MHFILFVLLCSRVIIYLTCCETKLFEIFQQYFFKDKGEKSLTSVRGVGWKSMHHFTIPIIRTGQTRVHQEINVMASLLGRRRRLRGCD